MFDFVAVISPWMSETADLFADVVLPAATIEKYEGPISAGDGYIDAKALRLPPMEPLFESRGEIDIYIDLTEKMGLLHGEGGYLNLECGEGCAVEGDVSLGDAALLVEGVVAAKPERGLLRLLVSTHELRHVYADFKGVMAVKLEEDLLTISGRVALAEPEGYDPAHYLGGGVSRLAAEGGLEFRFVGWRGDGAAEIPAARKQELMAALNRTAARADDAGGMQNHIFDF